MSDLTPEQRFTHQTDHFCQSAQNALEAGNIAKAGIALGQLRALINEWKRLHPLPKYEIPPAQVHPFLKITPE